nr:diaminopimelate decarboxylase [Leucobacter exalbidus]
MCAVIDLDTLDELVAQLQRAYPAHVVALHTVAAKSLALRPVLKHLAELGLGCEVASPGELQIAFAAGFPAHRIIYDSPAKTVSDIAEAISHGVHFNVDNFEELARVDRAVTAWHGPLPRIGFRINPQSGAGSIEAMSTGTPTSKFGIGLADFEQRIIDAYVARPWMTQVHVHSGSQGVSLQHTAGDIAAVVRLAEKVEAAASEQRISTIDVGGGLSVNFQSDEITPTFDDHARALHEYAPALFSGKYRIATEFGRALTAKAGMLIGRVEYVKQAGPRTIAVTPIGVQVATRTVFMPDAWPLRVEVYSPEGVPRSGAHHAYDIAGPACFAGDLIATNRQLPKIHAGDLIAVPDTGGYYATNHFSYNSLPRPAVYTTRAGTGTGTRSFQIARRAQLISEVVAEAGEARLIDLP